MSRSDVHPDHDETLFTVIARQARGRSSAELWTTAVGGAVNAALLALLVPGLSWLATGFLAVASYGVWGLADRAVLDLMPQTDGDRRGGALMIGIRHLAAAIGIGSAIWTMLAFMASALSNWNH